MLATVAHLAFVAVAADGPCDILGRAGNPCVAAHSTVRALYSKYAGPVENQEPHPPTRESSRETLLGCSFPLSEVPSNDSRSNLPPSAFLLTCALVLTSSHSAALCTT